MKKILATVVVFASATSALFASPWFVEKSATLVQDESANDFVKISYSLESAPAIVTVEIQTNRTGAATADDADWIALGDGVVKSFSGDVNQLVETAGAKTIMWDVKTDFPEFRAKKQSCRAVVRAWAQDAPPDYAVVDLRRSADRGEASDDLRVRYYTSSNAIPGGVGDDRYRSDYLVMRLIRAQGETFRMGSPATEVGRFNDEDLHAVTFTNCDYYVAIYPTTVGQALNFGTWGASGNDKFVTLSSGTKLYQYGNYTEVYGTNGTALCGSVRNDGWPANGHVVDEKTLCGLMRARTGVAFDLPTEAQWEFACRAGTGTALNNGANLTNNSSAPGAGQIAWYDANSGKKLQAVGLKLPNAWGLYDMHGNAAETTLDWYVADLGSAAAIEPVGPTTGSARVHRGGTGNYALMYARSASRSSGVLTYGLGPAARFVSPVSGVWQDTSSTL